MATGALVNYSGTQRTIRSNGSEDLKRLNFTRELQSRHTAGEWYVIVGGNEHYTQTIEADYDAVTRLLLAGRIQLADHKHQRKLPIGTYAAVSLARDHQI